MKRKSTIQGSTEGLVLGAVAVRSRSGYEILQAVKRESHGEVILSPGVLYPVLHKLERQGMIDGNWSTVKGRRQKKYKVTDEGSALLRSWQKEYKAVGLLIHQLAKS